MLLFVGLDNPQSRDPRHALLPYPKGCTGHRLFEMMREVDEHFDRAQYTAIPKTNLFPVGPCPTKERTAMLWAAGTLLVRQLKNSDKMVILFGNTVRDAVLTSVNTPDMMKFTNLNGAQYAWVPHPSGRNHFYNDTRRRRKVARFLQEARKVR